MTNKTFYKTWFALMIPLALQSMLNFGVQLLDGIMVADLGDIAVTIVNQGTQVYETYYYLVYGLSTGAIVLIAQYLGSNNTDLIHEIMAFVLRILMIVSIAYSLFCFVFPEQVLKIYTNEIEVINGGLTYLRITAISYFFVSISEFINFILKTVNKANVSTFIYIFSYISNLALNYLLIKGIWIFPQLGVAGAAIATLISRLIEFSCSLVFYYMSDVLLNFKLKEIFTLKIRKPLIKEYIKICLPVVIHESTYGITSSVTATITGYIGSTFVTSFSITRKIMQISKMFFAQCYVAASIIIGKSIGEKGVEFGREMGLKLYRLCAIYGLLSGITMAAIRTPGLALFNNITNESIELTKQLTFASIFISATQTLDSACFIGILRGAGDTKFAMIVDGALMILLSCPLAFLSAFVFKWPNVITYLMFYSHDFIKAIIGSLRIIKGDYIKKIA